MKYCLAVLCMEEILENIKVITKDFRTQKNELFIGIERGLIEKGLDTRKIVIADLFTEDSNQYYVVIVTPDKGVFEFYYDFLHKKPSEGKIIEWHDFTENPEKTYRPESVGIALKHFEQF